MSPNHMHRTIQQRRLRVRKEGKPGALAARVENHASVTDADPQCDRD